MHCSSHHPTTLLVALPTHKTPRSTQSWWPTRTGGTWVRPLCRKPAPRGAASPSAAAPSCLRTRGGLERNPTDNPTSRPEGPPQVLFFASDFNNETNKKAPVSGIRTEQRRRASGGGAAGKKTAGPPSSRSPGPETEDQAPRAPQNQLFRPRKTHTARTLILFSGYKEPTSSA